jgi:type IV pilus assembly protein PilF
MQKVNQLIIFLLISALMLSACNTAVGPSSNQNIRPSPETNDIAKANLNLGIEYLKQGRYEDALESLEKAKAADSSYSATYNMLGLLHQKINKPKKAEQYFKKAISLNSNDSSALNNYGNFLCENNRFEEMLDTYSKAAKNPLYSTPEIAITNAGLCLYNNSRKDEAKIKFQEALKLNPKVPQALIKMSEFSVDEFNYLSARAYLQRYQQVSRHTARSLWLGIQIERELGDKDAVSSYALLLKNSFPDSDEAAALLNSKVQ